MFSTHTFPSCLFLVLVAWLQTEPVVVRDGPTSEIFSNPLLQQVPQSSEDVQRRMELAQSRLDALRETIEEGTDRKDPAVETMRATRSEVVQAWEAYLLKLQRFTAVRQELAELTSPEHLESFSQELTKLQEETSELKRAPVASEPTEEEIADLRTKISALESQVNTLAESQTRLSQQLAGGFEQQTQALQEELTQIRQQGDELAKRSGELTASAESSGERQRVELERERVAVRVAAAEVALQNMGPEAQDAQHALDQGGRRLAVLRERLSVLRDRLNTLAEARTRARVKELEASKASGPAEMALRDLQLFRERVLLHYFQDPKRIRRVQERFPQRLADRLKTRVDLAKTYWERALESLDYRSGDELATLLQRAREETDEFKTLLGSLRNPLARTLDEVQELQAVRDRAVQRFGVLADQIRATAGAKDAAERTQLDTAVTTERVALEDGMRLGFEEVEKLSTRLEDTVSRVTNWVRDLQDMQQTLRWARLGRRDSGLWGAPWSAARADLVAFWQAPPLDRAEGDEAVSARALRRELFGEQQDTFTQSRRVARTVGQSLSIVPTRRWFWTTVGVLLAGLLGIIVYRSARKRGVRLAREIVEQMAVTRQGPHAIGAGLSKRINLMLLNMVGDLAIPLLVAGALAFAVWRLTANEVTEQLVSVFFGTIALGITVLRLVHHLFEAESPPHRPIPCSDRVARHYRKWLGLMILFSLVVLLVPLMFSVTGLAPGLRVALFEVHKTGFLVLILLFLIRKECVLGLGDVGALSWGLMLTWIAYPVLVLAAAALLVLQVIGYGVLVTYVGTGLLLTVGILIVMGTGIEYVNDMIDRHAQQVPLPGDARSQDTVAATGDIGSEAASTQYVIAMVRWFVRIAGVALTILLILRAWDVPVRAATLDWGRIGVGLSAFLLALLLDRLVLTTLVALHTSGRLPESTVHIIRRWVRGVLTIIVGLLVVAIAGFEVKSLWALLATFLGLVAIGFVAVWSILSNILATLIILIWRPFNVGERITVLPEGLEGQVIDINFMYTTLKSDGGSKVAIPNNFFAQKFVRRQPLRGEPKRSLAEQLESEEPLSD